MIATSHYYFRPSDKTKITHDDLNHVMKKYYNSGEIYGSLPENKIASSSYLNYSYDTTNEEKSARHQSIVLSKRDFPADRYEEPKTLSNFPKINQHKSIDHLKFNGSHDFMSKFSNLEENLDVIKSNPLLYNININKKKSDKFKANRTDLNQLKYLREIIENRNRQEAKEAEMKGIKYFNKLKKSNNKKTGLIGENPYTFFEKYSNEELVPMNRNKERIWVDNQAIDKTNIDLIAQKVLKKCNFIHAKNKNNQRTLRKGDGKVMITAGLTVKDFGMKFKLPI